MPIDRWLVAPTSASPDQIDPEADDPLAGGGEARFPDRDTELGPGYWHLVRHDGDPVFDLAAVPRRTGDSEAAESADRRGLAEGVWWTHLYLRVPQDRSLQLALSVPECGGGAAWLNGQPLAGLGFGTPGSVTGDTTGIRLGAGWNTLLVAAWAGECSATLAGRLLPGEDAGGGKDEPDSLMTSLADVRIQASRPPGIRRTYPAGWISVSGVRAGGALEWTAGYEELIASVTYTATAWGRGPRGEVASEPETPPEPPAVDLTGTWNLRIFAPQGIQDARLDAVMAGDGTLSGELTGTRLGGDIREGRVSGTSFRFLIPFSGGGREIDLVFTGDVAGDSIRGTVSFGEIDQLTSRFRGGRVGAGDAGAEGEPDDPGEGAEHPPAGQPAEPREPPPGAAPDIDAARRALARQRLLPPLEPRPPAPNSVGLALEAGDAELQERVEELRPARPVRLSATLDWEEARDAALAPSGVQFKLKWDGGEREFSRPLSPDALLHRLHEPIKLQGWIRTSAVVETPRATGDDARAGLWIVPDALSGFSLLLRTDGAPGEYWLNGDPLSLADGAALLCDPCEEGERLILEVKPSGEWAGLPGVVIREGGYPAAEGPEVPGARAWLEALDGGGNDEYLELSRRYATPD